jgi:hypothetical protein
MGENPSPLGEAFKVDDSLAPPAEVAGPGLSTEICARPPPLRLGQAVGLIMAKILDPHGLHDRLTKKCRSELFVYGYSEGDWRLMT